MASIINLDNPSLLDVEKLSNVFKEQLRWERIKTAALCWAASRAQYPQSCDLESGY